MAEINDSIRIIISQFSNGVKRNFPVRKVILFGSYADGTNNEWSDIDLAVITGGQDNPSREIFSFGKDIDLRIDAFSINECDFNNSRLPIVPEIIKNGVEV